MNDVIEKLSSASLLHVQQVFEAWEFIGIETRNKYKILDENNRPFAFAAEKSTGLGGALLRHFLGHWRSFEITIFNEDKRPICNLRFPFRFFLKTLEVSGVEGESIGRIEQRFSLFRKKFEVSDPHGLLIAEINSGFLKFWTFEFFDKGKSLGKISKKWSGGLSELFTDKDNFVVTFEDSALDYRKKLLMLSTSLMVDLIYFEKKANH